MRRNLLLIVLTATACLNAHGRDASAPNERRRTSENADTATSAPAPAPPAIVNLPAVQTPAATTAPQQPAAIVPTRKTPAPATVSRPPADAAVRGQMPPLPSIQAPPQPSASGTSRKGIPDGSAPSAATLSPPALVPVSPATTAKNTPLPPDTTSILSDYSIGAGAEVSAGKWTFSVKNNGPAHPEFDEKTGSYVVFSVGKPCATTGDWHEYSQHHPLPKLAPGGQTSISFSMKQDHINNGCKIKAEIKGPVNDVNLTNNLSLSHTNMLLQPDLVITNLSGQGKWPGGSIVIENIGKGAAGPSTFHFYCVSKEPGISCGAWGEKLKTAVDRDMPVPALQPGEKYSVMKQVSGVMPGTPVKVSWTGVIDPDKKIAESNEMNNQDALNQGVLFQ